jgi:hypothetical protein
MRFETLPLSLNLPWIVFLVYWIIKAARTRRHTGFLLPRLR